MTPSKDYTRLRILQGNPIVDNRNRKGDRHREGYVRPNPRPYVKEPSKWERRSIVAWDGEGANLVCNRCSGIGGYDYRDANDDRIREWAVCKDCHASGTIHVYNLLANSNNDLIINLEGLSTIEVFDFFMTHSNPRDINVIYGGSYDINMILKDVPKDKLQRLWDSGSCYWNHYRIIWATRKKFSVQKVGPNNKIVKSFVLWDVIGYFQSSFVVACQRWLGELPVLDDIQSMKLQRSTFKSEDIDSIIEYNKKECLLLVLLMERLFSSLDEAEVKLVRYDGAGSIAAALLKKHNIKDHKGKIPAGINKMAQYAYSGGRIEAVKCGTTTKKTKVYRYDINSAYPAATLTLPSYVGATWIKEKEWDGSNNSLVQVRYHFDKEAPFYPLWYRDNHGGISYPRQGRGIYWGAEVANLFKYYEEGKDFEIEWAINCTLNNDTKPFTFNKNLYELRKKFKAEGSMASESLKLGLNSEYGKLVQQAGWKEGRIPTYHQLLWGGQITAYTRAKLFDAAMQNPKEVISFATDAVFTTAPLDLDIGGELGQWTFDLFQGITIVQAGVYFLDDNGSWYEKFRGFDKGSLKREEIIKCWEEGAEYEAELTRFVGLGSSLASTDFSIWRTWKTDKRKLDVRPTGKRIPGKRSDYHKGLRVTSACPNITPDELSEPYPIVWLDGIKPADNNKINGVTLETLVDELEDGEL